jgi:hypothetical protein
MDWKKKGKKFPKIPTEAEKYMFKEQDQVQKHSTGCGRRNAATRGETE